MKAIYSMVGMIHHGSVDIVKSMKDGESLTLVRDPNNRVDYNAVQVWGDGKMLAYVKGSEVAPLARWMDERGTPQVDGKLTHHQRWPHVEIEQ